MHQRNGLTSNWRYERGPRDRVEYASNNNPFVSQSEQSIISRPGLHQLQPTQPLQPTDSQHQLHQLDSKQCGNAEHPVPRMSLGGWLAWCVIVVVTIGMVWLSLFEKAEEKVDGDRVPPKTSTTDLAQVEMQGKNILYQKRLTSTVAKEPAGEPNKFAVPRQLDQGTLTQRWCFSIMVNEYQGSAAAIEHLGVTRERVNDANLELDSEQEQIQSLLHQIFESHQQETFSVEQISAEDFALLKREFGWFGDLLLSTVTNDEALRESVVQSAAASVYKSMAVFFGGGFLLLLSLPIIIGTFALFYLGQIKTRFQHQPQRHNLYVQTFAIWLVLFFGGQILLGSMLAALQLTAKSDQMAWALIPFLGSLVALGWPVLNGLSFKEVCNDIGWKLNRPFVEIGLGIPAYWMLLPFLFGAAIIVVGLNYSLTTTSPLDFTSPNKISHPIQELVSQGNVVSFAIVVIMACVAAPLVEETMFRGVLYRHLRDYSIKHSKWFSISFAALVNSFIFAAIHPQGLIALPLLGTLAIGFSLMREYRDSLIVPMIMHGINNLIVTLVMFWMMG